MKKYFYTLILSWVCQVSSIGGQVSEWLTTPDRLSLLREIPPRAGISTNDSDQSIVIEPTRRFQEIDGFGFALTGGSAQHLMAMTEKVRDDLLKLLFGNKGGSIGLSYLRISIGASDLNERVFSYDDLPEGETDLSLEKFNLGDDLKAVVPILKQIRSLNPNIKILGSPWSAPAWMKTNRQVKGGKLRDEYRGTYANYFVKYIKAMAQEGIPLDAITVQNEPFNDGNTPSMQMFAKEQARFIGEYLGPAFRDAGLKTKIICYDHNCDAPEFPISVLTEPTANPYVDGSGFHLYAGPISALSEVHRRFPDKNLYFTEMMAVDRKAFDIAKPVARILVGATRNWSRNVILWNLAANSKFEPHTDDGGCSICQGAVTIDGDLFEPNLAFYVIAHASKFVPANSIRIESNATETLPNVAFLTPKGDVVVVVANLAKSTQRFSLILSDERVGRELPAGAVATYLWRYSKVSKL